MKAARHSLLLKLSASFLTCASATAQPAAPAAPPGPGAAPVKAQAASPTAAGTALYESWWKITGTRVGPTNLPETRQIGYAHLRLSDAEPTEKGAKPGYVFESEMEIDEFDGRPPLSLRQEGTMDTHYVPVETSVSLATQIPARPGSGSERGKAEAASAMTDISLALEIGPHTTPATRLAVFNGGADRPKKEWVLSDLDIVPLGPLVGRIAAQRHFLETSDGVMNLKTYALDGNSAVTSLKVVNKGNDSGRRRTAVLDKEVPSYELELSYALLDKTVTEKLFVDADGNGLEWVGRDWRAVLAADEKDAKGGEGKFRLSLRGRRDPFRKSLVLTRRREIVKGPKPPVPPGTPGTPPPPPPPVGNKELQQRLDEYEKQYAKVNRIIDDGGQKDRLFTEYAAFMNLYRSLRPVVTDPGQVAKVEDLREKIRRKYKPEAQALGDAQALLASVQSLFDARQFDALKTEHAKLEALAGNPVLQGTPEQAQIQGIVKQSQALMERAETILAFQRENIDLTGLVYNLEERTFTARAGLQVLGQSLGFSVPMRLPVSNSYAILNGRVYSEGEEIKTDLSIRRIERDGVVFLYKGEEVKRFLVK